MANYFYNNVTGYPSLFRKKGFTLVETIVAVGIIVLMITVPISGYIQSSKRITEEIKDLTAIYLSQEAVEITKMSLRASSDSGGSADALQVFKNSVQVSMGYYFAKCTGECNPTEKKVDVKFSDGKSVDAMSNHLYQCGKWDGIQYYCKLSYNGVLPFSFPNQSAVNGNPISSQNFVTSSGVNQKGTGFPLKICTSVPSAYAENCTGATTIFTRQISVELKDTGVPYFCIKEFSPDSYGHAYDDSVGIGNPGNHFYDAVRLTASTTWNGRKTSLPSLSTAVYRPFLSTCD